MLAQCVRFGTDIKAIRLWHSPAWDKTEDMERKTTSRLRHIGRQGGQCSCLAQANPVEIDGEQDTADSSVDLRSGIEKMTR